ncbi:MAG: PLDc N-terminal domain-containing protein [Planctomycetia bacterium]|nr:PLDc N-terminal domain-containing protein [Planctomycetia bacterium]
MAASAILAAYSGGSTEERSVLTGNGSPGHKLLWTILILLLPVIGLVLYLLLGRSITDRSLIQ